MEALAMEAFWTRFVYLLAVWLVAGGCVLFVSCLTLLLIGSCFRGHVRSLQAMHLGKAVHAFGTTL